MSYVKTLFLLPAPLTSFTATLLAIVLGAMPVLADDDEPDDGWGDDDWGDDGDNAGFADVGGDSDETEEESEPSNWSITGFLRSDWGIWAERFDDNPFAKGRQSLDLSIGYKGDVFRFLVSGHGEYDLAYLYERDSYAESMMDAYEWLADVRESYLGVSLEFLDIALGRQIVVWGEGDMVSLVDVVNPRDLREPGLADLDDLRLPVLVTRLGLFSGYHRVEALIIHEAFFGYRSPPYGSYNSLAIRLPQDNEDWARTASNLERYPIYWEHKQNRFSLENQQFLMRWSYKGPGIDLGLYFASVLDQAGVQEPNKAEISIKAGNNEPGHTTIPLDHRRYLMIGHSGAWPISNWLIKWEFVANIDRAYNTVIFDPYFEQNPNFGTTQSSALGGMLGVTYTWSGDAVFALELGKNWLLEDIPDSVPLNAEKTTPVLALPVEEPIAAFRYMHTLFREDLTIQIVATMVGWFANYGWIGRADATYTIVDGFKITLGYITYQPVEKYDPADTFSPLDLYAKFSAFSGFVNHDRVFLRLRWDFTIY